MEIIRVKDGNFLVLKRVFTHTSEQQEFFGISKLGKTLVRFSSDFCDRRLHNHGSYLTLTSGLKLRFRAKEYSRWAKGFVHGPYGLYAGFGDDEILILPLNGDLEEALSIQSLVKDTIDVEIKIN